MTDGYETAEGEQLLETLEEYDDVQQEVVEALHEYSEAQDDLWRQVPYRALKAQGWTGFRDKYSMAYQHGFWQLDASIDNGRYTVYVDLESGELVRAGSISTETTPINEIEEEAISIIEEEADDLRWHDVTSRIEEQYGIEGLRKCREMRFRGSIDHTETGTDMLGEFSYEPARDKDILALAESPEELNASRILERLEEEASYERPREFMEMGLEELEDWQEKQAELYGVDEMYSRE